MEDTYPMTDENAIAKREAVRARLIYNPATGLFTWKNGPKAGRLAGSINAGGYQILRVTHDGVKYQIYGHQAAWLLSHSELPGQIDHINRARSDNRLCNLRASDATKNAWNTNSLGYYAHSCGLFHVTIMARGRCHSIGYFRDEVDARQAYLLAKELHHAQ